MLNQAVVEDVLNAALETGGDFAEVFVEDRTSSVLQMLGGDVDNGVSGRDFGVGIRILDGTFAVYAYTNDADRDNLIKVARAAAQAIRGQATGRALDLRKSVLDNRHEVKLLPQDVAKAKQVEWMRRAHLAAKAVDPVIAQTKIGFLTNDQRVLIANSDGLFVEDRRVRSRMMIEAIASRGTEKQTGFYGPGAHAGLEYFANLDIEHYARVAGETAKTMIDAEFAPSGKMPVILDNEFGGVIFHEACGHGLEATSVAKGASVFAGKMGQQVASPLVTAVDDGTIPNGWGSQNIDDEGAPTQRNVLIENGILKGYLIDKVGSRKMNMASTGSSRRESYKFAPTSRMTNTYIAAGQSTPEEIIANTEYALYAKYLGGGSVNTATGDFNFAVREGYIVRNGKIEKPVRGATLIGKGIEVLQRIDMVGQNLGYGQGMCGSVSGSIPADVGQPMIRVSELTVGGRKGGQ
ncbi:TldD/PmbA family protein [Tumebacillus sp. DT12]|uniref:TldD/PmbA family protein n=1 Tax=Tumebacillus lacus TaxID=2995335 RepID=A0ABT3WWF8_9BACL|nr:TldD/PmbA family protein [Tumebacillus lacus]MCX7569015.1 TldD/PmbA family protein [Tumebacillus lacus]